MHFFLGALRADTDLEITRSFCGSQIFLPWKLMKELLENDHKSMNDIFL